MTRVLFGLLPALALMACTGDFSATRCSPTPGGVGEACTVFHQVTGSGSVDPTLVSAQAFHNGQPAGFSMTAVRAPIVDLGSAAITGALQGAGFYAGAAAIDVPKSVSTTVRLTQ